MGLLDDFFDGRLTPLVETARGCPFTCNFCNAYHNYFNKVNLFSDDYVREELTYVARRASQCGSGHITFADNNFGMIPRDARTSALLAELRRTFGWPKVITVWTGKNSQERVIEVTRELGAALSISMAVQSMDDKVLLNIGRKNIKLEHYRRIAEELNAQGRPQHAEVIMPLPGETLKSHISGLNELLDTSVSHVLSHTLQMLHGTPYKDDDTCRAMYGYVTKRRIVPLDFSKIDDTYIFDTEEVAVATDTMSFEEYVAARNYLLTIDLCYNSGLFTTLKKYLAVFGIRNSEWIRAIHRQIDDFPAAVRNIFDDFTAETRSELWNSEEDLVAFYSRPENFQKLIEYRTGGNVLFKHRVWMLTAIAQEWVEVVFACSKNLILERLGPTDQSTITNELSCLQSFILGTVVGALSPDVFEQPITRCLEYDVLAWLSTPLETPLEAFAVPGGVDARFDFSPETTAVIRDAFKRYGTDLAGLTKMLQRTAGVSITRRVSYPASADTPRFGDSSRSQLYGPGSSSL
jgi:hypothetical protein